MKIIGRHKFTIFVVFVFIVLTGAGFFVKEMFFSNNGRPVYGNRLEDMKNVLISDKTYSEMTKKLKENDKVKEVKHQLSGKIIDIFITVDDAVSVADAKTVGGKVLEFFKEEELAYYDIQIYMKKTDEALNNFPIIGYKKNSLKNISWSKDRQVSEQ